MRPVMRLRCQVFKARMNSAFNCMKQRHTYAVYEQISFSIQLWVLKKIAAGQKKMQTTSSHDIKLDYEIFSQYEFGARYRVASL